MITDEKKKEAYYKMLLEKNSDYEGIFYVGVKTTGIFCRPTCPARKPKKENCEFFETAKEALLASYRPCKRCRPLTSPTLLSPEVKKLVEAIERNPEKKWTDKDFDELAISANTARRQFKKQFGMTFIEYARSRRLGLAFDYIRNGKSLINAQQEIGYDSSNGFRDAFVKIMGTQPKKHQSLHLLTAKWLETELGSMIAIADEEVLYLLEFVDRRGLEKEIENLRKKFNAAIIPGTNQILTKLEDELSKYFKGQLSHFSIPLAENLGTPFQKQVWKLLREIPLGSTISYKELAIKMGNEKASRAVARANGTNQIAILIPCHRVINSNQELGGYSGGVYRKEWLLKLEKRMADD
ncbi:bifunctional transcriptional activator/DNA repair enzyme AdaA [Streptococcus oricebi]|uniref:Bifunctional transcriptional activator/DNA repair enzyme protein Ada n=1 Tax=Streptococcus oricebi TaxID=1547447 RepID=A0ABS5B2V5_9STRE|nr:trifunctional transcriptional activator/DNA repair protein Ada/methylated-DNA--[protein]-cysteine S-methyltransferase [Streptococcus oricebi]MBP2622803.1 bifunctional transcriptional activator/DNA repair enzyme protein Ada [Streptococcus oricebi]